MYNNNYESHIYDDLSFPIFFHTNTLYKSNQLFRTHWHENIEILYVIEGTVAVLSDENRIIAHEGNIVVINSNNLHHMQAVNESCKYYCLIVDKKLCEEFDLFIDEIVFQELIDDKVAGDKFNTIKEEIFSEKVLYKSVVKAKIIDFLIYLYRKHTISELPFSNKSENNKIEIIKNAIRFIQNNFSNDLSIDDIAKEVGLSKSYFCRVFKEITGYTAVFYINLVRCLNAKKLLQTSKYTVSEAGLLSGFYNLSYFSKTYKRYIGCLPSTSKNSI